ncbi:MAG: hypothetical protein OYH77_06285 [Pseudomonadota bacterium]|nr:hypothetical protein [Pseudomonadota bacterium]
MILYVGITVLVLLALFYPLFFTRAERLVSCQSINDPQMLRQMREQILQQYLGAERDHQAGRLRARTWKQRQEFLCNRYVDVCRRYDWIVADERGKGQVH